MGSAKQRGVATKRGIGADVAKILASTIMAEVRARAYTHVSAHAGTRLQNGVLSDEDSLAHVNIFGNRRARMHKSHPSIFGDLKSIDQLTACAHLLDLMESRNEPDRRIVEPPVSNSAEDGNVIKGSGSATVIEKTNKFDWVAAILGLTYSIGDNPPIPSCTQNDDLGGHPADPLWSRDGTHFAMILKFTSDSFLRHMLGCEPIKPQIGQPKTALKRMTD